jgi:DMSO/TMAO reductase YedYZ molybdopterin-dependent catalytic subunit
MAGAPAYQLMPLLVAGTLLVSLQTAHVRRCAMAGLISRGFLGRRRPAEVESRLPPGQYLVTDFPVLSAEPTAHTPLDRWSFTMEGLVRSPVTWSSAG